MTAAIILALATGVIGVLALALMTLEVQEIVHRLSHQEIYLEYLKDISQHLHQIHLDLQRRADHDRHHQP